MSLDWEFTLRLWSVRLIHLFHRRKGEGNECRRNTNMISKGESANCGRPSQGSEQFIQVPGLEDDPTVGGPVKVIGTPATAHSLS